MISTLTMRPPRVRETVTDVSALSATPGEPDARAGRVEELKTTVQDLAVAHGKQSQDLIGPLSGYLRSVIGRHRAAQGFQSSDLS